VSTCSWVRKRENLSSIQPQIWPLVCLWLFRLKKLGLDRFEVLKTTSGVKSSKIETSRLHTIFWIFFYVGWVRGTLVCDNLLSLLPLSMAGGGWWVVATNFYWASRTGCGTSTSGGSLSHHKSCDINRGVGAHDWWHSYRARGRVAMNSVLWLNANRALNTNKCRMPTSPLGLPSVGTLHLFLDVCVAVSWGPATIVVAPCKLKVKMLEAASLRLAAIWLVSLTVEPYGGTPSVSQTNRSFHNDWFCDCKW
jgi:hypothetical protein